MVRRFAKCHQHSCSFLASTFSLSLSVSPIFSFSYLSPYTKRVFEITCWALFFVESSSWYIINIIISPNRTFGERLLLGGLALTDSWVENIIGYFSGRDVWFLLPFRWWFHISAKDLFICFLNLGKKRQFSKFCTAQATCWPNSESRTVFSLSSTNKPWTTNDYHKSILHLI